MNAAAAVLTFREGLEAALIVAVLLTYLRRSGRTALAGQVWLGAGAAALLAVLFAVLLQLVGAEFEDLAEAIFEGVTSLLAVVMVTSMTFWMARHGRALKQDLEQEAREALHPSGASTAGRWGLFGVAFLSVAREGVETGLFLAAAAFESSGLQTLAGGVAGLVAAAAVAWCVYAAGIRLNLRRFFRISGVLLVFFGAAMLSHAVHEFEEVGALPALIEHVWDTSAWLPDESGLGGILAALAGYSAQPSLLQLLAYALYFGGVLLALAWPSLRRAQPVVTVPQAA